MYRFFHSNNPICTVVLIILATALQSVVFMIPSFGVEPSDGILGIYFKQTWSQVTGVFFLVGLLLFLIDLYLVHKISNMHKMLGIYSFATALFFTLFHAYFVAFIGNITTSISVLLLLLFIYCYTQLFERNFSLKTSFNMGLIVGIGVLVFKPFVVFLLLALWGSISFRSDFVKVIGSILVGLIVPFYFLFTCLYLNNIPYDWKQIVPMPQLLYVDFSLLGGSFYFYAIIFCIALIQGFFKVQGNLSSMLIFNRNIFGALSIASVLIIFSFFLTGTLTKSCLHLFAVPASFMLAYVLKDYKKKWVPELYFWTLLCLIILNNSIYKN